jgi:thiosulfate/3-mercaptopyruvate sulfurtransferase
MPFRTLISTDVLAMHLGGDHLVVVDCRFKLDDEAWGAGQYAAAHIPGAVYAHLGADLSGPKNGSNGRHPLPEPGAAARTVGRLGIASGVQVIAYDQDNGIYASRLWWLLRWLGHDAVAVLDGGFAKWIGEGRATTSGAEHNVPREFTPTPRPEMSIDVAHVQERLRRHEWRLLDARAPERYRGDVEPIDAIGGHIPGAANHFFGSNLRDGGTFRSPEELRARFKASIGDTPPDHVICYCGSGVTACHNLLALEHAGITGAKLYAGSWSEWSSAPSRPIEKGAAPA